MSALVRCTASVARFFGFSGGPNAQEDVVGGGFGTRIFFFFGGKLSPFTFLSIRDENAKDLLESNSTYL